MNSKIITIYLEIFLEMFFDAALSLDEELGKSDIGI